MNCGSTKTLKTALFVGTTLPMPRPTGTAYVPFFRSKTMTAVLLAYSPLPIWRKKNGWTARTFVPGRSASPAKAACQVTSPPHCTAGDVASK